jgi:indole-3-glycerol phosphate synthase
VLHDLIAGAREDASARRSVRSLATVEAAAFARDHALDAVSLLAPAERVRIIAEVKRASPSRGPLADIEAVKAAVGLPVLRKDLITDPYQVFEARAAGADIVLPIVAALEQGALAELHALAGELGMSTLVETHSADEVSRALDIGAEIVGVNARNLNTFELDQDLFGRLADSIPSGVIRVAESAVTSPADVAHYRQSGADVVLVGEALVTGGDPVATIHEFLAS